MNKKFLIGLTVLIVVGIIFIVKVNSGGSDNTANTKQSKAAVEVSVELQKGMESFKNEKYPDAISHFDKVVNSDSRNKQAYYFRGYAKLRMTDFEGAYTDVAKAYELDPKNTGIAHMYESLSRNPILNNPEALKKAKEDGLKKYGK